VRVIVTGAAGFIGSNFVDYLLEHYPEHSVTGLDKLTYAGIPANLEQARRHANFTFVQGDICDEHLVGRLASQHDAIVNFAAESHIDRSIREPGAFVRTDVVGAYVLLEASKRYDHRRFIQISTSEVYGDARSPEGESRPSKETDPLMPLSPYAGSKAGADRLAFSYWATYRLPVVVSRCTNNYGPRQYPEKVIPLYITNALAHRPLPVYGDGSSTREWLHVRDHCSALDAMLHSDTDVAGKSVLGEVFNVGGGVERSALEVAHAILDLLGKPRDLVRFVPDRKGHVPRIAIDPTKIGGAFGWHPSVDFETGFRDTVQWYVQNPQWIQQVQSHADSWLQSAMASYDKAAV